MKVKPMIFNTEMVKAILEGRKTVTRRPMNPQPEDSGLGYKWFPSNIAQSMVQIDNFKEDKEDYLKGIIAHVCPIACKGDLIYVRETLYGLYAIQPESDYYEFSKKLTREIRYVADGGKLPSTTLHCKSWKSVPSIHMPRWASRLTLKVTDVRIEKVQDITPNDAIKEGFNDWTGFAFTWSSIYLNQGLGWDDNPYVWVIEFEVIHKNVDKYLSEKSS